MFGEEHCYVIDAKAYGNCGRYLNVSASLFGIVEKALQVVHNAMLCLSIFSSKECIIKQLLDSNFVISGMIMQSLGECYQPRPPARLIALTST